MRAYELREQLVQDKFRPKYHFSPPGGRWNDVNGAVFWKGRYHLGYLQKIANGPNELDFSSWQHISSRDLLHWTYHRAYLREPLEGKKGDYFNSGDVMEGAEIPTIITNMPRKGICIYQCHDDNLDHWVGLTENPVIPLDAGRSPRGGEPEPDAEFPECVIFDPSGWKEGDTYYALIGNKNFRPGYEGDTTSLFRSADLRKWDYVGPFYRSSREWTEDVEDCACSDFFPFGEKHMLLMHTHRPFYKCQYYIGRYESEAFHPETNGQLSYLGSMLGGPETLVDDKGRRIFWGWVSEARDPAEAGWSGMMTLPWHLSPAEDNNLRIDPVEELRALRYGHTEAGDITLAPGEEVVVDELCSDCMEAKLTLVPGSATTFGMKLLCSPGCEEQTVVTYDAAKQAFSIDLEKASRDTANLKYPTRTGTDTCSYEQVVPYRPGQGDELRLDIFVDKSVIEIFVNSEVCLVQRVYPERADSKQFRLFAQDGSVTAKDIVKWKMDATNPW